MLQPQAGGTQQVSEDAYRVDLNEIEHVMENLGDLSAEVRTLPDASDDVGSNGTPHDNKDHSLGQHASELYISAAAWWRS